MVVTRSHMKVLNACQKKILHFWNIYNTRDPISLERIKKKFPLYRNGIIHYYDAITLRQYIISTGDYRDPITRFEYYNFELMKLDRYCNYEIYSLMNLKHSLTCMRTLNFQYQNLLQALENEFFEYINYIESNITSPDIISTFRNETIGLLIQCFENFLLIDKVYCSSYFRMQYRKILNDDIIKRYPIIQDELLQIIYSFIITSTNSILSNE